MDRLLIRTEASEKTGMGHFMRCFAIAEYAHERGIEVHVLVSGMDPAVRARCPDGMTLEAVGDFGADLAVMKAMVRPGDWLLIDSYKATADYIAGLHRVTRVAVMDDLDALDRFDCDMLINPALAAPGESYGRKSVARRLMGPDYALIRAEFRQPGPPLLDGRSVALMFGGSDPEGLTPEVAARLHPALPDVILKVIIGPASRQLGRLEDLARTMPRLRLFHAVPDLGRVLAGSDLVITAAGGSVGEVAAMGLPALVLVAYDNQKAALEACPYPVIDIRAGLPGDLSDRVVGLMADTAGRAVNGRAAQAMVDGRGAQRVVEAMFGV